MTVDQHLTTARVALQAVVAQLDIAVAALRDANENILAEGVLGLRDCTVADLADVIDLTTTDEEVTA